MRAQALSAGIGIDLWVPQSGVVHSVFERAINLAMDGELWTVLAAAQQDAPFGILLADCERRISDVARVVDRVQVRAGYLRVGRLIVDGRAAVRWAPQRWGAPCLGLEAGVSLVERKARARAWLGSAELAGDMLNALGGSDADLARAVRRSVGRGPGLTPAGDDVLVGILTVLTAGAADPSTKWTASRLIGALANMVHSTSDISRHLLSQAARGLPSRALHDLGKALYEGVADDVLAQRLQAVLDIGCTSGADACLGVAAACRLALLNTERLAS